MYPVKVLILLGVRYIDVGLNCPSGEAAAKGSTVRRLKIYIS